MEDAPPASPFGDGDTGANFNALPPPLPSKGSELKTCHLSTPFRI